MKKIAFLSNGCQAGLCKPREIIAADPDYCEVTDPKRADILMVNFCAISAQNLNGFESFRQDVAKYKKSNPRLKVIAGGCIEGLSEKKDLGFADVIYHHQEEAEVLAKFLGKGEQPVLAPAILNGAVTITIAQGCNRRCTFCKVHYLKHMQLTSRPMEEILDLAQQAITQGYSTVSLVAENSTEYGMDIGTNLQTLLKRLLALDGLRLLDVSGLCLDEVTPSLLQMLKHPKIRKVQLEVQSLDDQIRKNMGLRKTTEEALDILSTLSHKYLMSNFMYGFPGHSDAEYRREMRKIRARHLYYLSLDDYDDTPGVPSHEKYQPLDRKTETYYRETFLRTVAKEREILLGRLMREPYIEASVMMVDRTKLVLVALHYTLEICAEQARHRYRVGDVVRVKVTGLHEDKLIALKMRAFVKKDDAIGQQLMQVMRYFNVYSKDQVMSVDGEIIGLAP